MLFFAFISACIGYFILYAGKSSSLFVDLIVPLILLQCIFFFHTTPLIEKFLWFLGQTKKDVSNTIGLLCCVASIIFCMSPLASLREVYRSKSTEILPFPLILSMFFVGGLWCLYGVIIDNTFIIYPNFLGFIIAGLQLLLFLIYPNKLKGN